VLPVTAPSAIGIKLNRYWEEEQGHDGLNGAKR
jgi:hypothetical protein